MSGTEHNDPFFQFPLCLMNMPDTERERANCIVQYSIMQHGLNKTQEMTIRAMRAEANQIETENRPGGLILSNRDHLAYAVGMVRLKVKGGHVAAALRSWRSACSHVNSFTAKHGRDAVVRLRTDIAFDCLYGRMTWRDFSTLAAVYSIIGLKPYPVLVYRSMIRARQLGYKSPAIMQAELKHRKDLQPMTENQIRYTLDSLENAGWFARVQASKRKVFFSHRLTRDQIKEKLLSKYVALGRTRKHRTDDRDFQAKLKQARAGK